MEALVNDLSLHGQFPDVTAFKAAIQQVMTLRALAKRYRRDVYCHRNLIEAQITPTLKINHVLNHFELSARRSIILWLQTQGPFWDDERAHGCDDWLSDPSGDVVTDTALAEAAFRRMHGADHHLVSFAPSDWMRTPLAVAWTRDDEADLLSDVPNHWAEETFEAALKAAPKPLESWNDVTATARARFNRLVFADDAFEPLHPCSFHPGAASALIERLDVLHRLTACFDANGKRSPEGQRIYNDHFADKGGGDGGGKSWFSPSSNDELNTFKSKLTFVHPDKPTETLICSWHGKVKIQQLRIHFHWPFTATDKCYVVYVGPKLTKR